LKHPKDEIEGFHDVVLLMMGGGNCSLSRKKSSGKKKWTNSIDWKWFDQLCQWHFHDVPTGNCGQELDVHFHLD
jgi:hypothetical protein